MTAKSWTRKRRGYTLIEMIIAMSIFSVLLTINAKWIHESIKFASKVNDRKHQQTALNRLDSQLRSDIRQAQQMSINDQILRLNHANDLIITYSIDGTQIETTRMQDSTVIYRDRFSMGNRSDIKWDRKEMPKWISLVIRDRNPSVKADSETGEQTMVKTRIDYFLRAGPNPWSQ